MQKKVILEAIQSLEPRVGDEIVVYDVEARKVLFFHQSENGIRTKYVRNKRGRVTSIRKTDRFVRVEKDGKFTGNKEGFAVR